MGDAHAIIPFADEHHKVPALAEAGYWIPLKGDYTYDGFVHMSKSDSIIFLDDEMWTDLPYAHQIQLARKRYGWDRRLMEEGTPDNSGQHGSWRCDTSR